jgi:DNA ligase D
MPRKPDNKKLQELIKQGERTAMPSKLVPMFATLTDAPFDDKDWIYEIKWDGYRAVAYVQKGKANIFSRTNLSFTTKFAPVAKALAVLPMNAVLDGEIVCLDEDGKANFQLLQQWQKTQRGELVYYVFDILWVEGYNVMNLPLHQRKEILRQYLPKKDAVIRFSDHVQGEGLPFYEAAQHNGLEGIMAKHIHSSYAPAVRTKQWLKIKTSLRQEVVIGGFTETRGSRKHFGALVLGIYDGDDLVYVGHTGTGFNERSLGEVYKKLKKLVTTRSPFSTKVKTNTPVTWVQPKLVCEIKFSEWTRERIMRIPVFMGLREDKSPKDVHFEKAIHADPGAIEKQNSVMKKKTAKKKNSPVKDDLLTGTDKKKVVVINKKELTFTNLDKLYWPDEKISKRDLLNYYYRIAPYILPYLKDRPQSLNRLPNGIKKPGFYQKDVAGKVADWIVTHDYVADSDGEKKEFLVCTNEATLLYMANLGCIEMHPWHSTIKKPDNPTWCVIDLDPGKISFDKVIETAQVIKSLTDELGIETYCKTSGSTGLHIYIPLGAAYDYDQSRQLAELIVTLVHHEIPSFTSLERSPAKRRNKIYLDYLQNRTIQTIAAPYSLRPKPGATVSTPLYWEEVKKGLTIQDFDMHNIFDRIKDVGEIFTPVLGKGINLKKVLGKINSMMPQEEV